MNKVTKNDATFTISILPEDIAPEELFCDESACQWVREQLDDGNDWAWCQVTVTAELEGFKGYAFLGGCAYESEEAFRAGGYYEDLCADAFQDLVKTIDSTVTVLRKLDII